MLWHDITLHYIYNQKKSREADRWMMLVMNSCRASVSCLRVAGRSYKGVRTHVLYDQLNGFKAASPASLKAHRRAGRSTSDPIVFFFERTVETFKSWRENLNRTRVRHRRRPSSTDERVGERPGGRAGGRVCRGDRRRFGDGRVWCVVGRRWRRGSDRPAYDYRRLGLAFVDGGDCSKSQPPDGQIWAGY